MAVWTEKYIKPNAYSRPQKKLEAVRKIVIHYTANAGAGALSHYKYFNNLVGRYASAHFFVDKDEKLLIIPLNEIAYHANDGTYRGVPELKPNANFLSVGIELCMEKDGSFHPQTIKHAEEVAVELCKRYGLNPNDDIVRHYDITRKNCPAPWVSNPSAFTQFKKNVSASMNGKVTTPVSTKPVASKPSNDGLLNEGDNGSEVKALQNNLIKLGYKLPKFGADGDFGNETVEAVKKFQKDNKLTVDGIVGKATSAKINEKLKAPAKTNSKTAEKAIGNLSITTAALNIRASSSLDAKVVGQAVKGAKFPVYEKKNDMYRIGAGKWVSASSKYSKYTASGSTAKASTGKLTYKRVLTTGSTGSDVKALQNALNKLNFKCGTADGIWGAKTKDAVRRFQLVHLPREVDGVAGKNTINKINSLL